MAKKLVIVESPTKAKTIKKFLPKGFSVEASFGHVRDLPQTAADVPAKYKKEPWARLGINVENDFEPLYVTQRGKGKIITQLRKLLKEADELYLATDEDREGESISWHLLQLLKPKVPVKRMVFHEITKAAITQALQDCRDVDQRLVSSQETRRILDRLVGFTLSPLIWKKIAYGLSAGRVQSAGLRLLVERERERMKFVQAEYWDLKATLNKDKIDFEAKFISHEGKRLATGKDFNPETGKLFKPQDYVVFNEDQVTKIKDKLDKASWTVQSVEFKDFTSNPAKPFITSTLQQESNRKLGMSARQTMRTAQALYEQGLITYMRTDSPTLSKQAIEGARKSVEKLYGKEYLSSTVRQYSGKKGAQEAHEAIRPAGNEFVHPKDTGVSGQELALYDLIWKRTLACQMAEAKKRSMIVKLEAEDSVFQASGMTIVFPGFLRAYVEGKDDPDAALDDKENLLPDLKENDSVKLSELLVDGHKTKPVARFTEASLVQRLEKEDIGRPSTYASIISTILDRNYARKQGTALIPSFTGFVVMQLLEKHFADLVDYGFTSKMEETLDEIAVGKQESLPYLKSFYLGKNGLLKQAERKEEEINADESRQVYLNQDFDAQIRVGRFGPFLVKPGDKNAGVEDVRASIPEDVAPADLSQEMVKDIIEASEKGPESIGKHPDTGEDIYVLIGRYGPYVQLGEVTDDNPKPKRASVTREYDYRNLSLEDAVKLLVLPYEVGKHPETGLPIIANKGRFGPYLSHNDETRSVKKDDDIYTLTLERAVEILAEERVGRRGSKTIKDLGKHPETNKKVVVMEGKYGPYIKHGSKNFKLPEDQKAEDVTMEIAVKILE
ncbi:type I DNA topoisomerase [bacterium]|nr:type I DNA topoisomerase [bacterium]